MGVSAFHKTYWDGRAYRRTKIYQQDHTFLFGDVVRWDGATQSWVLASADTLENAEGLAVVSHSGYRGEDETASSAAYARRALPSYAFDHRTQTEQECNDPRHYFSVVYRGEITVPDGQDIDYSQHALMTGTESVPQQYTPGGVYYLSPFAGEEGKLICKSPLEFGGKMATTVVKPMLIALDHSRAVVVNYIGSKLDNIPDEWIRIQDVQKVGSVGAFLETNIPTSWIMCDGRLCSTAQYPQLADTIGGSVRVAATLTLEADPPQADVFTGVDGYCILDFSEEGIDVSSAILQEPLNIKLESSTSSAEVSAIIDGIIDANRLRVIVDTDVPLDGTNGYTIGQSLPVKVRAPYAGGIDRQFFVPNLRDRTLRGADPVAVFAGSTKQSDTGDYSGSNTVTLDTGEDILAGSGYSATVDNRADSVKVVFAIKAFTVDCGSFINECCAATNPVGLNDNAIVNGAFLVWQRGKQFTKETFDAQPQYTADRWFEDFSIAPPIEPPLTGTYHVLKKGVKYTHYNPAAMVVPLNPGEVVSPETRAIELPDSITSYAQIQGTLMTATRPHGSPTTTYQVSTALVTGADHESYHYLENRIEDVRTLSGEKTTLSFWARGTQAGSVFVTLRQHFAGTRGILDDAYSTPVQIWLDGSANWNRYEVVLDIPDVQDTKPSDGYIGANSFLGVQFWTMYFAGYCTGTANPTVYDVVSTPGPETDGVPLPVVDITIVPTNSPSLNTTLEPTDTPTPTASVAASESPTPSITTSPQPTIIVSVTQTPTISVTPSITVTTSVSVTPTTTISPSVTRTVTPTPTPTKTTTPTPTPTKSVTPTPTATPVTPTPSPSVAVNHECVTNCCLPVLFDSDFNYEGVLHLTGVQLLRGIRALPFEETDYLDELKKCQRYYEKDQFIPIGGSTKVGQNGDFFDSVTFMVQKRKLREPCVHIQGYFEPDLVTGCTLNTIEVNCYNDESAVLHLNTTPTQASLGLCAAYVEYEVDVDLYESPCPADPYSGTTLTCGWEEVS